MTLPVLYVEAMEVPLVAKDTSSNPARNLILLISSKDPTLHEIAASGWHLNVEL